MRARAAATGALLASLALAAFAPAADDASRQTATFVLTNERPGAPSGQDLSIDYVNPDDPDAKPPAVRRVVTILPRGSRIDTGALARCKASDEELMLSGGAACPPDSHLTEGVVTVDTGFPGPGRFVTADVSFFNNDHELIYVNTIRDSEARTVLRAEVTRRRIITEAPMLPGTPPDGGAIDTVVVNDPRIVNVIEGEQRSYITTPKRCRGRKSDPHWTTRVEFTYSDGVTQTVPTHTPCRKPRPR